MPACLNGQAGFAVIGGGFGDDLMQPVMPCLGGSGLRILEPSAGTGHLIDVILEEFDRPFVTAVELDPFRAKMLRRKYAHLPNVGVIESDFTAWAASAFGRREFDVCIMNPPFATEGDSLAYVNHIALAWSLLATDGQLASIVPLGIDYRDDDATKRLRQKMREKGAVEKLPELSFKEAGTGTKTAFVYAKMERDMDEALKKLIDDTRSDIELATKLMVQAKEQRSISDFSYQQGRLDHALITLFRLGYYVASIQDGHTE